jgi:hypothetical protein
MAFVTDAASYLSGATDSAFGPKKGGGMVIDPFTAVLGAANIGASLFGGMSSAKAQQQATNASIANQVAASNFAAQQQVNAKALQAAQGLLGMQFGELIAAPREFERQKEAQKFKFGELRDLQRAGESEDFRRQMARLNDPNLREAGRFQSRLQGQQQAFANRAQLRGMFGPVAEDMMFGA